jgi:hypothetical protein
MRVGKSQKHAGRSWHGVGGVEGKNSLDGRDTYNRYE